MSRKTPKNSKDEAQDDKLIRPAREYTSFLPTRDESDRVPFDQLGFEPVVEHPKQEPASSIRYRYSEDAILKDLKAYLDGCYDPSTHHYVTADDEIQTIDVWNALGSAVTTSRDTAIKYLMRYGKKDGNNKKDLMKALHFVVFMLHYDHYKAKNDNPKS